MSIGITEVEYIFRRREAVLKNAELIRSYLGSNAKIYFYDNETGEVVEVP